MSRSMWKRCRISISLPFGKPGYERGIGYWVKYFFLRELYEQQVLKHLYNQGSGTKECLPALAGRNQSDLELII